MTTISEFRNEITVTWSDVPVGQVCLSLFEKLVLTPNGELCFLTYPMLAKMVSKREVDRELVVAVAILVSSRINLLDPHARIIEEPEADISLDDLEEAKRTGILIHPETGYQLSRFNEKVIIYFTASSLLLAAKRLTNG